MKYPFFFLFVAMSFLSGCGDSLTGQARADLAALYEQKLEELRLASLDHEAGWPSDHDCDAALWAGIARAAGATWVDMSAALDHNGRPTRRPNKDCDTPHESATTTSNDMMTGIILGLYTAGDIDSLHAMWKYGYERAWVMGFPEWFLARVYLRPNGVSLLARALYRLSGGSINYGMRLSPLLYGPTQADYATHLTLLSRLIQKRVGGPQYGTELAEQILANRHPHDALAQAIAGKSKAAFNLLRKEYSSPSYVRGHDNYRLVHWLLAARVALDNDDNSWLDISPLDVVR